MDKALVALLANLIMEFEALPTPPGFDYKSRNAQLHNLFSEFVNQINAANAVKDPT